MNEYTLLPYSALHEKLPHHFAPIGLFGQLWLAKQRDDVSHSPPAARCVL